MSEQDNKVIEKPDKEVITIMMAISAIAAFIKSVLKSLIELVLGTALLLIVIFLIIMTYAFFTGDIGYSFNMTTFPISR